MKVRKPTFDLQKKLVRHYFKGNAFSTHLANSLHIIFPEGEKFFIRSCRKFLPKITNAQLKKEVKAFMGQEGMHAVAHNDFWQYLEKQGFEVDSYAKYIDSSIKGIEKFIYATLGEKKGAEFALSMTAGLEHYTSLLAEAAFENEAEFMHLPEEMRHLWFWHASEEIEHKSVAFDLLKHINDDAFLKNSGFTAASILLFYYSIIGQLYFLKSDKESKIMDWPMEFLDFMESIGGKMARKFYSHAFNYYQKDFHPSHMKNDHFAKEFFAQNERYQVNKKSASSTIASFDE